MKMEVWQLGESFQQDVPSRRHCGFSCGSTSAVFGICLDPHIFRVAGTEDD